MYLRRCMCDVLEEMRSCYKTLNFSYIEGLIEEVQSMANKMEAKLGTIHDWKDYNKRVKDLYKELKELEGKKDKLEDNIIIEED